MNRTESSLNAMSHLYILFFSGLAVCIEAGLVILRTPNPEVANGEIEAFDRLPCAF
jgi:hypothetical protein